MSSMADPMIALRSFQQALSAGASVDSPGLGGGYVLLYDEPNGGKRYSFPKIIDGEVQVLSIFGLVEPLDGVVCYSVGYAVSEKHRGHGLAVEAVNKGIEVLKETLSRTELRKFYVEALIDRMNIHSIRVAEQLFPGPGIAARDSYTGTPALHFKKLILLK